MKSLDVNGMELAYVDRGSGMPLLLIHGFPFDHTMWAEQISGLAPRCRTIAPDLRGFGQSRRKASSADSNALDEKVTMDQFADDLAALLTGLGIQERVVLCGLSMGGYIAFAFWRKYAARLRGLILCDTRAAADPPELVAGRLALAERVLREGTADVIEPMLSKVFAEATPQKRPELVEMVRQSAVANDARGVAAASRGMAERLDMTSRLAEITCPTLLIVGRSDGISPPAEMRAMAQVIPGARFVAVDGGHMSPLESPDTVNRAILDFLAMLGA